MNVYCLLCRVLYFLTDCDEQKGCIILAGHFLIVQTDLLYYCLMSSRVSTASKGLKIFVSFCLYRKTLQMFNKLNMIHHLSFKTFIIIPRVFQIYKHFYLCCSVHLYEIIRVNINNSKVFQVYPRVTVLVYILIEIS